MQITSELSNLFTVGVDALLSSDLAPTCLLLYPSQKTECPNCIVNPITVSSAGVYKTNGPSPFENGQTCPWCQGVGFIETEATDNIRLLIDWEPKEYTTLVQQDPSKIKYPKGIIKIQGYIADMQKLRQAIQIKLHSGLQNYDYWIFEKVGEPIPYGLIHNTYFSCLLNRIG